MRLAGEDPREDRPRRSPGEGEEDEDPEREHVARRLALGRLSEPREKRFERDQRRGERERAGPRVRDRHRPPLRRDGVARLADPEERAADPQRTVAIDNDARLRAPIALVQSIRATQILGDEPAVVAAKDAQMPRRDRGVVDDHVVVVGAADPRLSALAAVPRDDVAVLAQDLDPDHGPAFAAAGPDADQPIAPRKLRPSARALS